MQKIYLPAIILFYVTLLGCAQNKNVKPYTLNKPDSRYRLHSSLNEISGLQATENGKLLAVQDEKAIIFTLNKKAKIINQYPFGDNGDFEGITTYKQNIFVLKSNGHLYKIKDGKTKTYKFGKNGTFDFEGLCHDHAHNRLLLACKTHADKNKNNYIYIYGFNLSDKEFTKSPVYKIPKKTPYKNFKPSGIAIHPNGDIYILSSAAKKILVLNPSGTITNIYYLSSLLFQQPEGITFMPNGDLYICNEQKNTFPTLLKFKMD